MQGKRQGEFALFKLSAPLSFTEFFQIFYISEKKQRQLFHQGKIQVNHQTIQQPQPLKKGDLLSLKIFEACEIDFPPQGSCQPIYEDDCVCIINKPAGIIIHEDQKEKLNTLNNRVAGYYHQTHQAISVRPIHRLDMETSGLIIYSKCPFFQPFLDACLKEKKIKRSYYALIKGRLSTPSIFINQPIGKDRHVNNKYRVSKTGKPAQTKVTVIKSYHDFSFIQCELETGRTHQIRVHLAYLNHPLLSDPIYGHKDTRIKRCALQAYAVDWIDPLTQELKHAQIPLDQDFVKLMR